MVAMRFEERRDAATGERYLAVSGRGVALRDDPILNKGTCFTEAERDAFGLRGVLPPAIATPAEQEARAYGHFVRARDDVQRYLTLAALQDRNETLFYRLLLHHLDEMVPIVYTPTVGQVCEQYSHIYRRPRGIYVSSRDRGRIVDVLANHPCDGCRVIVITDNEAILGIGDQGVGGMGIAIGKLALYTAGAGVHPARGLALDFDVGTDNPALLEDELYLGVRERRLRGEAYDTLLDELVEAIARVHPGALVQWEDFAKENAFRVMTRYRRRLPSFNDDIQGTGAVVVAGLLRGLRAAGRRWDDERVVILGAGAAGAGVARAVRSAMTAAGVPASTLGRRVLCLDSRGLILAGRPGLDAGKREIAADPGLASEWGGLPCLRLPEVVEHFRPTALVGLSGQPGAFDERVVRSMRAGCERPVILPLSNPTRLSEAAPEDLLRWTDGAALVGTGSPFPDVRIGSTSFRIGQGNNALIFPGLGLGATAVDARWLPDGAFAAAADALAEFPCGPGPGAPLFPPLARLREVAVAVARAVGRALVEAGAAPAITPAEIDARIAASVWEPVYRPYRPAEPVGEPRTDPAVETASS